MAKKAKFNSKNLWETINIATLVVLVVMSAVLALGLSNVHDDLREAEKEIQQLQQNLE